MNRFTIYKMKKLTIDELEYLLCKINLNCPKDMFEELSEFQCDCEEVNNCFNCWYRTVITYQNEQFLKSLNDESEDK